jgi:hypothetical protein
LRRAALAVLAPLLLALAGCAGAGATRVRSESGPGLGFLTATPAMVRPLRPEVRITPILTAGDTLFSNNPGEPPFVFPGRAGGLGARDRGDGSAELYVSHEDAWLDHIEGAVVTRLLLDLRNAGVSSAGYILRPERGYMGFANAALLDSRVGFLRPTFVVNERGHRLRSPLVAAIDVGTQQIQDLPWLGAMRHKSTVCVPVAGKTLLVLTGGFANPAADQLYMYLANSDSDVLTGRGQLYVLCADPTDRAGETQSAASMRRGIPIRGTFAPVNDAQARSPATLAPLVQALGCLNFARLEGIAIDRERPNGFYFTDRLGFGTASGIQTTAGGGRLYHVTFDPFDPTKVQALEVLLDSGDGDDLYRPTAIDTDEQSVMIQEYPGAHGIHASRILRYDVRTRRLETLAECVERDTRGRLVPNGVGGEWEPSGIINVSDLLGEDTWLFTVQAHTVEIIQDTRHVGEAGQLLLLRGGRNPQRQ